MQENNAAARAPKLRVRLWDVLALLLLLALIAALYKVTDLRLRADHTLTVTRPEHPVTINGQVWDSAADLPLLTYEGVTYFPVSYVDRLGLDAVRTDDGLSLTVNGAPAGALQADAEIARPPKSGAVKYEAPVSLAYAPYSAKGQAPFLYQLGEVYMPLTEPVCSALCLRYAWSETEGLTITTTGKLRAPTDDLPRFILHMGGMTADGEIGTNSVEAASHSYREGYRWLEIDFNWTKDGSLVCTHDWGNWRKRLGIKVKTPTTLRRFYRLEYEHSATHSFTPNRLDTWLKRHPKAMIVTDAKEDNVRVMRWIAENYPDLRAHFIVQIYALEEYEPIRALGYENIILTMYKIPWEEYHDLETLRAFIRDTRVLAITMAADENVRDVFDALVDTGIPVYVHTLDEPGDQAIWLADGAYGIYTNYGDMRAE